MALINGSLQIGQTALSVSQAALSVTGNNISNSATEGYSRQVAQLAPTQYYEIQPGQYTGTGVTMYNIKRVADEALNSRARNAGADTASYLVQQQTATRMESAFNELTDDDISSRLNSFFAAWSSLQIQPEDIASRNVVLQNADSMTSVIRELRTDLSDIHTDLNSQIKATVIEADTLAKQIAAINADIVSAEGGNTGSAAALRDQRDQLLTELNAIVNISTREMDSGSVTVYIGSEPLIQYTDCRGLSSRETTDDNGEPVTEVIFTSNNGQVDMTSGKLSGLIVSRDELLGTAIEELDQWANSLIYEVNLLHTMGSSMETVTEVSSQYNCSDSTASLADPSESGLNWEVTNGVFYITTFNSTGEEVTKDFIKVDINAPANSTLESVAADINSKFTDLNCTIDGSGYFHIESLNGGSFAFSAAENDADGTVDLDSTTNFLAVVGINTFFTGESANDIALRDDFYGHPEKVVAGDYALGETTDGSIASQIAALATEGVGSLSGVSLANNFSSLVSDIASSARRSEDNYSAASAVQETLLLEVQSISGVSVDEEAMNMIVFQRAYQGAAKYIGVIDELLDDVIGLIR